jgi:hypothetical protein
VTPGDFPDDGTTSDHRPLLAWFQVPVFGAEPPAPVETSFQTTTTVTLRPTSSASAGDSLRVVAVDKREEYVDIANQGSSAVNLSGWVLRSERGAQDCPLDGEIEARQTLRIWAMTEDAGQDGFNCSFDSSIWNNSEPDPAVLLNPNGAEVSRFE